MRDDQDLKGPKEKKKEKQIKKKKISLDVKYGSHNEIPFSH